MRWVAGTGATRDAGIDRDHATRIGKQRIDVELADLGQVSGHLRQRHQHLLYRLRIGGRHITIGGEDTRDPRAGRIMSAARLASERRQGERLVVDLLHRRATAPEDNDGAEGGGRLQYRRSNSRDLGRRTIGCNENTRDLRIGTLFARTGEGSRPAATRTACSLVRSSSTPPTSDFVRNILREDLHGHRAASGEDRRGHASGLVRVARADGLRGGDTIGPEQLHRLDRIEPAALLRQAHRR